MINMPYLCDPMAALAVVSMLGGRPKRTPSPDALARVAELAAQGCLARVYWDDGMECVGWYAADHIASIEHFRSKAQHPGALTRRQLRLVRDAMRGER